ncbi:hypothetical protein [Sphingomonas crusticola]|uniref:hypothetical protein n=1 Tax=Sphingomonas crusticola TaxID=1697973 RepID=UPI0013C2B569|nr:hypothetical protein [Sphingomonas crusticola]
MIRTLVLATAVALAAPSMPAQEIVSGDAAAGLVSRTARSEVHLVADPMLNDRRLVLKIVILNLSGAPQPFGPDAVTVTAGETPIALMTRDALVTERTGTAIASDETAQAHTTAALPITSTGQTDVSGFTGSSVGVTGGVPASSIDRAQRRPSNAAALDAVLLKPITIRPNAADGGQVITEKLRRAKTPEVLVTINFAGDVHRFNVKVPR